MPINSSPWVISYKRNYAKFLDIFRPDQRIPAYFVPGNNDVGCVVFISPDDCKAQLPSLA